MGGGADELEQAPVPQTAPTTTDTERRMAAGPTTAWKRSTGKAQLGPCQEVIPTEKYPILLVCGLALALPTEQLLGLQYGPITLTPGWIVVNLFASVRHFLRPLDNCPLETWSLALFELGLLTGWVLVLFAVRPDTTFESIVTS